MNITDITVDNLIATVLCAFFAWLAITSTAYISERKAQRRADREGSAQ